jgi:small subunit ribosomal protein S14
MAKVSAVNKNNKRIKLSDRLFKKRQALKKIIMDKKISLEERFKAQQKLSNLPRNSAKNRVMNRCVYRKLKISRIALRDLGLHGLIPGMTKSSW